MRNTFPNNSKISTNQLKKIIVFDILSISMLVIPNLAVAGAGKDGLIALFAGTVGAVLYALLLLFFSDRLETDYMSQCRHTLGRPGALLFGLCYLVKYFFSSVFVLTLFTTIIHETILPNTNLKVILLFLFLISIHYGSRQFEVRARLVEVLYFIILIPLGLLFLLGIFNINLVNLFPLMTAPPAAITQTGYLVLLTYSALEMLLFAAPSVTDRESKETKRNKVLQAILLCGVFNLLIYVVVVGLLGTTGATQNVWSTVCVMQTIEIPGGFVPRQDAIMLALWMGSIFTIISTLIFYLCFITKAITGCRQQRYILWFYTIALFVCTMKPLPLQMLYHYYGLYLAYIGFPLSILLPLLLILVARIKTRGEMSHEKNQLKA